MNLANAIVKVENGKIVGANVPRKWRPPAYKCRVRPRVLANDLGRLEFECGVVVISEPNARSHWAEKRKRFREQAESLATMMIVMNRPLRPPCVVTLTRIGPRQLDSHDNLRAAFKGVVDTIAKRWLGIDDADKRVTWRYAQRRDRANGIHVSIRSV